MKNKKNRVDFVDNSYRAEENENGNGKGDK